MEQYNFDDVGIVDGTNFPGKRKGWIRRIAEVIGLAFVASVCLALLWVLMVEVWGASLPNVPVK